MFRSAGRVAAFFAAFVIFSPAAFAQINWNVTYADGAIRPGGTGFASPTVVGGTTLGQLRRDSVTAATNYLNTFLDGRGTVNLTFSASLNEPSSGILASFGAGQFDIINGSFQNGGVYQGARTNQHPFDEPDGQGQFNFGRGWNYAGQPASGSNFDMVTVAIHEITHGAGFLSLTAQNGSSKFQPFGAAPVGNPSVYTGYDRYLQRGNGAGGSLFNTDITNSNFGTFTGDSSTITNSNNPSMGLFFGGQYAREVFGGPAPLYAPNSYQSGSSVSHVNDFSAVMNPSISANTIRRYQNYEVAMLLDIGWNVYNWNNGDGNWLDGANGSLDVSQSQWRTDQGIVYSGAANGNNYYNLNGSQGQAPVLPPYGQVTSNIILNFGGNGSTPYTSQNDIGNIRIARLNLNSTASVTNTIANSAGNAGGTLIFGVNLDGTPSVLTPKIVQKNSGAFAINTNIQITDTVAGGGWSGLTVDGTGTGKVSLGGAISGTGTLTKAGSFTLELTGSAANTFTGTTTVSAGTLLLNKTPGQNAFGGNVTIAGGTLQLAAADQMPNSGTVTLGAGGTLSAGAAVGFDDIVGAFEVTGNSTIALGTGSHILQFTGFNDSTLSGVLTITGWTGAFASPGQSGRIVIAGASGNPNVTYAGFLSTVQFAGYSMGSAFISAGLPANTYELVPVPEPTAVLAIAFAGLGLGAIIVRRRRQAERDHPLAS